MILIEPTVVISSQVSHVADEASPSSTSSFEMLDMESVPAPYREVQPHWFFCRRAEDNTSWLPFSREDSDKLESACNAGQNKCLHLTYTLCTVHVNYVDSDVQVVRKAGK